MNEIADFFKTLDDEEKAKKEAFNEEHNMNSEEE